MIRIYVNLGPSHRRISKRLVLIAAKWHQDKPINFNLLNVDDCYDFGLLRVYN